MKKMVIILSLSSFLASCSGITGPDTLVNKENIGTLLGGAAGAWAGSSIGGGSGRIVATAAGAILGGLLGGQFGSILDDRDRGMIDNTTQTSLETAPSYQVSQWRNPDNGHRGDVIAEPVYELNGQKCRDFKQTIFVDDQAQTATGQACRQDDGTWKIVS